MSNLTEVQEDRRRYLDHREENLWEDAIKAASASDIEWLEQKCREIRATRRQQEQLREKGCD